MAEKMVRDEIIKFFTWWLNESIEIIANKPFKNEADVIDEYLKSYHNDIIRSGVVIEEDWDTSDLANVYNPLEEEFLNNVITVGTKVIVEEDTGRKSIKRLISYNPDFPEPYLTITEKAWNLLLEGNTSEQRFKAYKDCEEYIEDPIVELTLKDISEGKGVGVPPHLIKIVG